MINLIIGILLLIVSILLIIPTAVAVAFVTLEFVDWAYDFAFKDDDEK